MSGTEQQPQDDGMSAWAAAAGTQLDQSSIDNLFGASPETEAGPRSGLEVLVGGTLVGYDRLPMLDIIVDRFARLLTTSMRKFTADNCDISVGRTRGVRVGDFLNRISLPAMIAVIRAEQWDGYLLAALNASLIGSIIDVLLGGRRNHAQPIEGRPYTAIERTLIERLVADVIIKELRQSFDTVGEITFVPERYETTPTYAAITEIGAAAVTFRIEVAMDAGRGGAIDFLVPYSSLEPVRDILSQEYIGKKIYTDSTWLTHLQDEVPQANVELSAVLEQRTTTVRHVSSWRPGTVLVLDRRADDSVDLFCENMLVGRAHIAERDGQVALQVIDRQTMLPAGDTAL